MNREPSNSANQPDLREAAQGDFRSIDLKVQAIPCRGCGYDGTYFTGYGKIACIGCGLILCRQPGIHPEGAEALSDEAIEALASKSGARWSGDYWIIEDADLHPFARAILARATKAPDPNPAAQV